MYCRQQLADFQANLETFREIQTDVVAASVDELAEARKTVDRHDLTFPVAYGVDAVAVAERLGAYVNDDPPYIHSTGIIVRPDATVDLVVYSSGPIGRLVAQDTIGLIKYRQKNAG